MLPADYLKIREASTQFAAMGGIYVGTTYLTGDGQAERYDGAFADGHIFDVTGVAPSSGAPSSRATRSKARRRWSSSRTTCGRERFDSDPAVIGAPCA
jgi:hypothetical protein